MSLHPTGTVDNYVLISETPIKSLAEIKGRKIGAAGPNLPWVKAVGAAGNVLDVVHPTGEEQVLPRGERGVDERRVADVPDTGPCGGLVWRQ